MASRNEDEMSADTMTRHWVEKLEKTEAARTGVPVVVARRAVARRLGVAPGTIENLRRGRTKGVRAWIAERVANAVIREIEAELRGLNHELQCARQCGARAGESQIHEIQADVDALTLALKGLLR
jgi:hypothetical protein